MGKQAGVFLLLCLPAFGQRADFVREDVTFHCDATALRVEGLYWFANRSGHPVRSELFYPFPELPGGTIDSIRVFSLSAGRRIDIRTGDRHGISFPLFLASFDTALLRIGYRQTCHGDSAVYLLTTTQTWRKSLDRAEFKLVVPESVVMERFSYEPQKTYHIGREKIYYWEMTGFMPEKDMIFHFKRVER
jgi:hypothetical protein